MMSAHSERLLHHLRAQQLRALAGIVHELAPTDAEAVRRYAQQAGQLYDTRNLSDKSLESIDVIAGRYFQ
jgi:hypothetical protein